MNLAILSQPNLDILHLEIKTPGRLDDFDVVYFVDTKTNENDPDGTQGWKTGKANDRCLITDSFSEDRFNITSGKSHNTLKITLRDAKLTTPIGVILALRYSGDLESFRKNGVVAKVNYEYKRFSYTVTKDIEFRDQDLVANVKKYTQHGPDRRISVEPVP